MEPNREQITKALECCRTYKETDCDECPYRNKGGIVDNFYIGCCNKLCEDALSLIKELTEENERLKLRVLGENHLRKQAEGMLANGMDTVKADTVRKMQRLIEEKSDSCDLYQIHSNKPVDVIYQISKKQLDQIAKEMLEGETQ